MSCFFLVIFESVVTLQGTNISHIGKRKIIFKSDFWWDMLVPRRVVNSGKTHETTYVWICFSHDFLVYTMVNRHHQTTI